MGLLARHLRNCHVNLPYAKVKISPCYKAIITMVQPLDAEGRILSRRRSAHGPPSHGLPDDDRVVVLSAHRSKKFAIAADVRNVGRKIDREPVKRGLRSDAALKSTTRLSFIKSIM